jgi:hypothetical protein
MIIEKDTNIIKVVMDGKSWQIAYKVCDITSSIFSSRICFVLPAKTKFLNQ